MCILLSCVGTLGAQNVLLAYKFKPGDRDRYKETSMMVMSSEMMPGASQIFTNETYTSQKTETVSPEGVGTIIRVIDSTTSTMNGRPFENPTTKGAIGFPLRVKVAPTGKILSVEAVNDNLDQAARAVLEAFRSQLISQPGFPTTPVRPGDVWQDSSQVTQQTQMGMLTTSIRYSTTLAGTDSVAQLPVWVLKMSINLSGSIEGGAGTVEGKGEGDVYFSNDLGREVKSILVINQAMKVNSPQGSMTMTMKTTTTREIMR